MKLFELSNLLESESEIGIWNGIRIKNQNLESEFGFGIWNLELEFEIRI